MIAANQEQILAHLQALVGERNPESSHEFLQSTVRYVAAEMAASGLEVTEQSFPDHKVGPAPSAYPNIISHLSKKSEANATFQKEVLVVGAHYDTVPGSPGADDNASGLAVLLETARLLADMQGNFDVQFVAFSLEEQGYIGSEAFLQYAEESGTKIWGAIVLECVGYTDRRPYRTGEILSGLSEMSQRCRLKPVLNLRLLRSRPPCLTSA